jgi:(E)-4-hydroxy-3-methylbut-2-enyl-diphosphate synthase
MLITDLQTDHREYCNSLTEYSRYRTREVGIGGIPLGGDNPIRIQSMTTTDTMDTLATVEQSIRIIEAGADYVRITAPSQNEARNLEAIRNELRARGYEAPLIADIHYTPNAAEIAARIVEKVRVNPGNYADKKKFQIVEYTDAQYAAEIERIREKFTPLVNVCKEYGTAMRIGANHGSLSDRIMSRFGDTPLGMVESALEFARICADLDYHEIVLSMKASNTKVMIQAYRLLVNCMDAEGFNYPLHLGVTEAGEGEDGRIKSAIGIGALLEDGLGDTVRVSLTEEPEAEIPVCIRLVERYTTRPGHPPIPPIARNPIDPYSYTRRHTRQVDRLGGENVPVVILTPQELASPACLSTIGYQYDAGLDKWNIADMAPDFIYLGKRDIDFGLPGTLGKILDCGAWRANPEASNAYPLFDLTNFQDVPYRSERLNFVLAEPDDLDAGALDTLQHAANCVLILLTDNPHAMPDLRRIMAEFLESDIRIPVVFKREYQDIDDDALILHGAIDTGGLLADGLGDGIWLASTDADPGNLNRLSFGILQATRTRISKTEYISCPSCGRTLFDLQETTALIRGRTDHLKGVKIGIMGCIVNGPGEMADADYGYVGSGPGQITLYRGKEIVRRNVPTAVAVDELIELIRVDDRWVDA